MNIKYLLLLSLVVVGLKGVCWGKDCAYKSPETELANPTLNDLRQPIDNEIRRAYWYYLFGANILYQGYGDVPERYLFIFIYRNLMGTFLAIASWDKQTRTSEINTLVRLGNGYSKQPQSTYQPFSIEPFIISLRLGEGETLVEMDQMGNLKVDGQELTINTLDQNQIDVCKDKADRYLRKTYWYYIRGADLIQEQTISTNLRNYFLFTYVNIVGTFFVIATCDSNEVINANTFVRLGPGGHPSQRLKPNNFNIDRANI